MARSYVHVFVALVCLLSARCCFANEAAHDHDGHDDHGEVGYEWAGIFEAPEPSYVWTAQAVDGEYADPKMKMVVLPAAEATESALKALEEEALHLLNGECVTVEAGATLAPGETCYDLVFSEHIGEDKIVFGTPARFCSDLDTTFLIAANGTDNLAFFTEHVPTEFERSQHYLKNEAGEDIEPASELSESSPKPWGEAIGAAVIVNLVTLIGVLMLVPLFGGLVKKHPICFQVVSNSFAAGALLAAAFFLLLYEATHLIAITDERPESLAAASWGCMILFGFLTAPLIELATFCVVEMFCVKEAGTVSNRDDAVETIQVSNKAAQDVEKVAIETSESETGTAEAANRRRRVLGGVLIGDFMHNFCDGIFVGSAFAVCGSQFGWTVTAATVYHEIAQEISDYWLLTDPKSGALKPWLALVLNFVSGMSVILGVVIILAIDVSDYATGMILAYGGGVYIHIGAAEAMTRVYAVMHTLSLRLIMMAAFVIGASAIGLVLLDHEHCSAGGHAHAHGH